MYGGQWQLIRTDFGEPVSEIQMLQRRFDLRNPPGSPQDARQGPLYKAIGEFMASREPKHQGRRA